MTKLSSAVAWAQQLLAERVGPGDFVIDGTAGNGYDTEFLAHQVLPGGLIWAVDVQAQAIASTASRLAADGLLPRVASLEQVPAAELVLPGIQLLEGDHGAVGRCLQATAGLRPRLQAAVMNLGYLPGGDHAVVTQAASTIAFLEELAADLQIGGRLVVVVYVGHPGGQDEAQAVERWWSERPAKAWDTARLTFPNRRGEPPYVLAAEKKREGGEAR
ncbi:class I SAM-dependent methyltransferase [Heliophilum fasciatum]|uniref:Putative rRNA methylase n=1 Tax=Heliophilum fasciatum TaxID=35700 RepID=A0A4R2RUU5_9FIRM|nr:class I SAM-dependent methyltransferase [Heliophilum fasciatum]MCW2277346.1 putative methyltransferase [Heliophilum fasciatum]TCP67183.1 putative rRNA methylase [Heliophilum fasciatum]